MGVTGLWSLIDSVGHPISLESLENKTLAIDLSIWINQSIKGFRDKEGRVVDNAHILGLFHRICKLLFYKIKPVFVFDGGVPQLKMRTIHKRHEQRVKAINKTKQNSIKILHNYLASQLSSPVESIARSDNLPPLQSALLDIPCMKIYEHLSEDNPCEVLNEETGDEPNDSESDTDSNLPANTSYFNELDSIDINSDTFKNLPPDIRYEMLTEMKLKYKGWRNMEIMPQQSTDFSNYQMKRLLKKRELQANIECVERELNARVSDDLIQNWNEANSFDKMGAKAGRLISDENTHFIFMKKFETKTEANNSFTQLKDRKACEDSDKIESLLSRDSSKHFENKSDSNDSLLNSDGNDRQQCKSVNKNELNDLILSDLVDDRTKTESLNLNKTITIEEEVEVNEDNEFEKNLTKSHDETIVIDDESDNDEFVEEPDARNSVDKCSSNPKCEPIINRNETSSNIRIDSNSRIDFEVSSNTHDKTIEINDESDYEDFEEVEPIDNDFCDSQLHYESDQKKFSELRFSADKTESSKTDNSNTISPLIKDNLREENSPIKSKNLTHFSREKLPNTYEINKQNRFANVTTEKMVTECQELLKLFGVPFVKSPMEAEAQCAALEELGLTNGTITDDSDVLLFGAQTVYKNFFTTSKYVEVYKSSDIESSFGLTRSSLICIAMLCGSDYTDGVTGVGPVAATEILAEFSGDCLEPLIKLKNWWLEKKASKDKRPENKNRAKFMKLNLGESFPNQVIYNAYINPTVDNSEEKFSWSMPQLDDLRQFASNRFGWSLKKIDDILLPVMKKVNDKQTQMKISDYFKVKPQPNESTYNRSQTSKRLTKAIDKLRGTQTESCSATSSTASSRVNATLKQKVKNQRKKRVTKIASKNAKRVQTNIHDYVKSPSKTVNLSEDSDSE